LLLEAGGADDVPSVMNAGEWRLNLGSERDWKHHDTPNRALNGRALHALSLVSALRRS
jgi:choline dehydrogenase